MQGDNRKKPYVEQPIDYQRTVSSPRNACQDSSDDAIKLQSQQQKLQEIGPDEYVPTGSEIGPEDYITGCFTYSRDYVQGGGPGPSSTAPPLPARDIEDGNVDEDLIHRKEEIIPSCGDGYASSGSSVENESLSYTHFKNGGNGSTTDLHKNLSRLNESSDDDDNVVNDCCMKFDILYF